MWETPLKLNGNVIYLSQVWFLNQTIYKLFIFILIQQKWLQNNPKQLSSKSL